MIIFTFADEAHATTRRFAEGLMRRTVCLLKADDEVPGPFDRDPRDRYVYAVVEDGLMLTLTTDGGFPADGGDPVLVRWGEIERLHVY